jgi:hypothetical protein
LFGLFAFTTKMPSSILTRHDLFVLEKIKDPESGPSAPVLIDSSLPRDPHITDDAVYQKITQSERTIISSIQDVELQIANLKPAVSDPLAQYLSCVERLDELVGEFPSYASAKNNRAQALRRIYGDGILVKGSRESAKDEATPLDVEASNEDLIASSNTILDDLGTAISLLTPATPFIAISCEWLFESLVFLSALPDLVTLIIVDTLLDLGIFQLTLCSTSSKNTFTSIHSTRSNLPSDRQALSQTRHGTSNRSKTCGSKMVSS